MRRALRPSRVAAVVLGWIALWLGAAAYAYCVGTPGSPGPRADAEVCLTCDHGRMPRHLQAAAGDADCPEMVEAATVSQRTAVTPDADDSPPGVAVTAGAKYPGPRIIGDEGAGAALRPWPRLPDRPLYLRNLRLLI